jgi:glycosyltransferase involved in cell wall biosynthesis
VAGTGPLEQELRARYARARFLGHLTGRALEDAIRGAAVVVVPSEWYENCPISILEAMAYGKTVVASDIGGIPELVVHGETGLLFPAGDRDALTDCLTRLVGNAELRRRYGAAARVRAEQRFSVERHRSALLRLYLTVLESREGRQADRNAPCASTLQE